MPSELRKRRTREEEESETRHPSEQKQVIEQIFETRRTGKERKSFTKTGYQSRLRPEGQGQSALNRERNNFATRYGEGIPMLNLRGERDHRMNFKTRMDTGKPRQTKLHELKR